MCAHLEEEQDMSVMTAISPRTVPHRGSAAYCGNPHYSVSQRAGATTPSLLAAGLNDCHEDRKLWWPG